MTTYEQIPPFLAEMPEPARASYLSPEIAPKPLPCELTRVMPWHDELLPADLREYVRDVAERTQCPPDFIGVALVVAVSAVVGRKFTIHPKQHDDWMVVPNQWGIVIGRPSAMKSPALKQALRPLHALESRARKQYGLAEADHKASSELLEMERNAAKVKAKKLLSSGDKNAALAERNRLSSDMQAPVLRRYSSAGDYLCRFAASGLAWPCSLSDSELEQQLFPPAQAVPSEQRPLPDWAMIHAELRRPGVTLALLWQEYRLNQPQGFQYSWFCENYRAWQGKLDVVMAVECLAR